MTDGCSGVGHGSLRHSLETHKKDSSIRKAFPLPFSFPAKIHILCVSDPGDAALIGSLPLYQELIDINGQVQFHVQFTLTAVAFITLSCTLFLFHFTNVFENLFHDMSCDHCYLISAFVNVLVLVLVYNSTCIQLYSLYVYIYIFKMISK